MTGAVPGITLVLGGARSGKSVFGEALVLNSGLEPVYVATAQAWDDEMRKRIVTHKARRGGEWVSLEEPDDLEGVVKREARAGRAVLVDCLTVWITNLMMADADVGARCRSFCETLAGIESPVVLVSNEVGLGIVPENKMAREFRDHAGRLHQDLAALAREVYFIAAGLPLKMKG